MNRKARRALASKKSFDMWLTPPPYIPHQKGCTMLTGMAMIFT